MYSFTMRRPEVKVPSSRHSEGGSLRFTSCQERSLVTGFRMAAYALRAVRPRTVSTPIICSLSAIQCFLAWSNTCRMYGLEKAAERLATWQGASIFWIHP
ncbi:hypothetical protein L209DRAFT_195261 [Thermothelomyces heterothallicus CBS 203.75]